MKGQSKLYRYRATIATGSLSRDSQNLACQGSAKRIAYTRIEFP